MPSNASEQLRPRLRQPSQGRPRDRPGWTQLEIRRLDLVGKTYIGVVLLFGPASVMSVAAGLAFGLWAIPFVLLVATTSGAIAFVIARYLARDRVVGVLEGHPNFQAIGKAIDGEGWKVAAQQL